MKNMTAELNQNGIHYTLHGDYYLPDLELPEKASASMNGWIGWSARWLKQKASPKA